MRLILVIGLLGVLGAGCERRPSTEQCQRICARFNELGFWEAFAEEVASLTAAERAQARAEREKLWDEIAERAFDPGLENCVTECERGGEVGQVACMKDAKTGEAARACFPR